MKLERISYKKRTREVNSKATPHIKTVIEKIDDIYYTAKNYCWSEIDKQWYPSSSTAFFDGEKVHDVGSVKARPIGDVDKYFEMLVEYEKFTVVNE